MASTLHTRELMLNSGMVYLGQGDGVLRPLGECESLVLGLKEERLVRHDRFNGGLGDALRQVKEVSIQLRLRDFRPDNLALALSGEAGEVVAGHVAGESHAASRGGLLPLARIDPAQVVAVNNGVTLTEGVDYQVTPSGLLILDDAPHVADNDTLEVSYDHGGHTLVTALTNGGEFRLLLDAANDAESGRTVTLEVFRVCWGMAGEVDLLAGGFGVLTLGGDVLRDETRAEAGEGAFFTLRIGAP